MNQQRQTHRPLPRIAWPCALLLTAMTGVTANAADLESTEWQLTQVRTGAGLTEAIAGGGRGVWRFSDGRVSGSAGCNRLLGGYRLDGDRLSFEPNLAGTMMACPPPLMEQEQAVVTALGDVAGYELGDAGLALTDAQGTRLLTFAELEAMPLTGTDWRLVQYNNGKGALVSVLGDTAIRLRLDDGGRFSGKACNAFRGGYRVEGRDFSLDGPVAATRMLCPEPEGADEQERAFFAALERAAGFGISGNELLLTDADGKTLAKFRAVQPGDGPSEEAADGSGE
jgi:heat shock protein HslJ